MVASKELEEARIRQAYARRNLDDPRYSYFNTGHLFMLQERERAVLALLAKYGFTALESKRILEIGCGTGQWLRDLVRWGAKPGNITGIDLLSERIAEARKTCPKEINLQPGNATTLEFPDSSFDMVIQSTVFTSILDFGTKQQVASEMKRVLRNTGLILWYDFHVGNPANPDVRGVGKKEINALFSDCHVDLHRMTLAPPLARSIAPYSWSLTYLLERIPFLCTHYLGIIRKHDSIGQPPLRENPA